MSEQRRPYVVIVDGPPPIANPLIQRGFTSIEKVGAWALKHGHTDVYWWKEKETVYVPRKVSHAPTA